MADATRTATITAITTEFQSLLVLLGGSLPGWFTDVVLTNRGEPTFTVCSLGLDGGTPTDALSVTMPQDAVLNLGRIGTQRVFIKTASEVGNILEFLGTPVTREEPALGVVI